ncbi:cephalosporin hydroxylase-domain-containing protein [Haematococcus lacustris]
MTTAANISDRVQITVDLVSLLDYEYYLYGIFWSPRVCFPAFKTVYPQLPDADLSQLTQRYVQAVQVALAEHLKVPPASIALDKPWTQQPAVIQEFAARHQQQGSVPGAILNPPALTTSQMAADPVYLAWRKRLTLLNSAWFTEADSSPVVECPPTVTKGVQQPWEQLGTKSCVGLIDDTLIIEETGYAFMPHMPLTGLGEHLKNHGICTSQPYGHGAGWGDMMLQQRMGQPQWQTYRTQRPEHDTVLELFDILYERTAAFTKQHFMGVISMQNPPDMYAIADIIYTQKPDLIIETGTANGGSSLTWAGIMELADCPDTSRVFTVDVNSPSWLANTTSWGGRARQDPMEHKLWKKRVTFIQGMSTAPEVVAQMRRAAAAATRVLVLLDSDHSSKNVQEELDAFCLLVTPGSYCVVQDTKMSRWGNDGPLPAVKRFLGGTGSGHFIVDREREPFYTHHAQGYLMRQDRAPPQVILGPA